MLKFLKPFTPVPSKTFRILALSQMLFLVLLWILSPWKAVPSPLEVAHAWVDMVQNQALLWELAVSMKTNFQAILLSSAIGLVMMYASTAVFFKTWVRFASTMRFLGFAGLTFLFTLAFDSGQALKLALLVFGMTVFLITNLSAEVDNFPQERVDHARTLGMKDWHITWETVVLGKADVVLDLIRQNAAIGWTLLSMVEGLVRSEGGIGALLLNQNRHFHLGAVFAIQFTILFAGWIQDVLFGYLRNFICPYANLNTAKH